jgi:phospholipid/cholesterol/gamma-HCH transport system permease protein
MNDNVLLEQISTGEGLTLRLKGAWCIDNLSGIDEALDQLRLPAGGRLVLECSELSALDLSAAWLLRQRLKQSVCEGTRIEFAGEAPRHFAFIEEIAARDTSKPPPGPAPRISISDAVGWVGRTSVQQVQQAGQAVGFFGRIAVTGARALRSVRALRLPSITRHVYETGIQAVPIVALIAFLISVIVAYLGAQQLRPFGAEIFTVDLVAIAVLREMGVLLTAIIVAGRSGSAFAAEIGVMRLNDEIDALQAMGIDTFEVLILPRLIGLLVALPLLTIIADATGLAGGALLSSMLLDISLTQFIARLEDALAPTTFWAGLIKAPFFAALIAMVGTYRGLQVRDSSRELGRLTTVAVVQSIFLVIFADAVFAVVFVELDF